MKDQSSLEHKIEIERNQITMLSLQLFKYCTDENAVAKDHKGDSGSIASANSSMIDYTSLQLGPNIITLHPMIVVLEDLNLYDALSFHLIR